MKKIKSILLATALCLSSTANAATGQASGDSSSYAGAVGVAVVGAAVMTTMAVLIGTANDTVHHTHAH